MAPPSEVARLRTEIAEANRRRDRARVAKKHMQNEIAALRKRLTEVVNATNSSTGGAAAVAATAAAAAAAAAASFDVGDVVGIVGSGELAQLHGQEVVVLTKDVKKSRCKVRFANGEQRQVPIGSLKRKEDSRAVGMPSPTCNPEELKHFGLMTPLLSPSGLRLRSCLSEETGGLPCEFWPLVKTGMARLLLPPMLVASLQKDVDAAARKKPMLDHSQNSASEFRNGCQVLLKSVNPEFERILLDFCRLLGWALLGSNQITCELDTVWGVVQREGDYSTFQTQQCRKSQFGFSSVIDVHLPPQLNEANHDKPSKGSYGYHDGMHSLMWKTEMSTDMENLVQPGILQNILVTGYLYIFPQWIPFSTHPFEGEGERKLIAANVAVSNVAPEVEKMGVGPPTMSMGAPAGISTGH